MNLLPVHKSISEIISSKLSDVAEALRMSQVVRVLGSHIVVHTFHYPDLKNTLCSISVFPTGDRAEEAIDTVITISFEREEVIIKGDMAWSEGQMISELLVLVLPIENSARWLELVHSNIQVVCEVCTERYIELLKDIQMRNQAMR